MRQANAALPARELSANAMKSEATYTQLHHHRRASIRRSTRRASPELRVAGGGLRKAQFRAGHPPHTETDVFRGTPVRRTWFRGPQRWGGSLRMTRAVACSANSHASLPGLGTPSANQSVVSPCWGPRLIVTTQLLRSPAPV